MNMQTDDPQRINFKKPGACQPASGLKITYLSFLATETIM